MCLELRAAFEARLLDCSSMLGRSWRTTSLGIALALAPAQAVAKELAEDPPGVLHTIGLESGVVARNQRDEAFSPVRHEGALYSLGLVYAFEDDINRHEVRLGAAAGRGRDLADGRTTWFDASMRYRYERRVTIGAPSLWIGVSAGGGPQVYRIADARGTADRFSTLYDVAPRARIERIFPTRRRFHALDASIEIPVALLAFRPSHAVEPTRSGNATAGDLVELALRSHRSGPYIASLHNAQSVRFEIAWTMGLGAWLEQRIAYRRSYQRVALFGETAWWDHLFVYGLHFTL